MPASIANFTPNYLDGPNFAVCAEDQWAARPGMGFIGAFCRN